MIPPAVPKILKKNGIPSTLMKNEPVNLPESPSNSLSANAVVCRQEGVVLRQVAGEQLLVPTVTREVDLDSLFLLNATGVFVWEHLDGSQCVADLAGLVAKAFSISSETAKADVIHFLSSLLDRNLAGQIKSHGN